MNIDDRRRPTTNDQP